MVGRFYYSPQAIHLSWSFGTRWADSLTHPRLDISRGHSACGGEILILSPGWTSLMIIRHVVGRFSYSPQAGHLSLSFGAWWGDSLTLPRLYITNGHSERGGEILLLTPVCTSLMGRFSRPRLDISRHRTALGGEILLLAPGWTPLAVNRRVVGRFPYSPQVGHLSSSFDAWWGDSLTRPGLDISCQYSARGGEILLLASGWTSLMIIRRVVERFSY